MEANDGRCKMVVEEMGIFDFDVADIKVENYESEPAIKAPVAV